MPIFTHLSFAHALKANLYMKWGQWENAQQRFNSINYKSLYGIEIPYTSAGNIMLIYTQVT